MRKLICLYFSFFSLASSSQEIKFTTKIGYGIVEMKYIKKNSLCTDNSIGYEFKSNGKLILCVAGGISKINFDYTDTSIRNVYIKKSFITLPISIKRYYTLSKKTFAYWEFGVSFNYQWLDKIEIRNFSNTIINKQHDLGMIIGGITYFGLKTKISNKIFLDLGLFGQTDFFSFYKTDINKIKSDKRLFAISFNKTL